MTPAMEGPADASLTAAGPNSRSSGVHLKAGQLGNRRLPRFVGWSSGNYPIVAHCPSTSNVPRRLVWMVQLLPRFVVMKLFLLSTAPGARPPTGPKFNPSLNPRAARARRPGAAPHCATTPPVSGTGPAAVPSPCSGRPKVPRRWPRPMRRSSGTAIRTAPVL